MSLKQDEKDVDKVLEEHGVKAYMYYFSRENMSIFGIPDMDRINGVAIASPYDGVWYSINDSIHYAISAVKRRTGFAVYQVFAEDLKRELARNGIHGVAIWDSRDKTMYYQLARTISKGRLRKHVEKEPGMWRLPPRA